LLEEFGITADKAKRGERGKRARERNIAELDLLGDARPLEVIIKDKENQMREAAKDLEFELATILRDEIRELRVRAKTTEVKEKKKRVKK